MKTKTTKPSKKYSLLSNVFYSLRECWRDDPSAAVWAIVGVIAQTALPFVGILMPKLVIDALTRNVTSAEFLLTVGVCAAALVALNYLQGYTGQIISSEFGSNGSVRVTTAMAAKQIDMDYELLSDPDVKILEEKAYKGMDTSHSLMNTCPGIFAQLLVQIFGFVLYGAVITSVHWAILPLIALSAAIGALMQRRAAKYEENKREDLAKIENKMYALYDYLTDAALTKDLRLYGMLGWIRNIKAALLRQNREERRGVVSREFQASLAGAAMILLRDGAAYALLVYLLINGRVTLGDFTLMFAAIGAFAGWIQGIVARAGDLQRASVQISDYREYLDIPDRMNRGPGATLPQKDSAPEITLENVSYTYPKAETPALENISLTIKAGERLAVVGVNGAGKSTLVKLICGLYRPTSGVIRLNGVNIAEFNRDEYYTLFSAVFQEIHMTNDSIAGNVSQQTEAKTDRGRVRQCLALAGLLEKADSLPKGMDTPLLREIESEAAELSGGEKQKLALARAIYKEAPVIILDEPTAALDPIAESETYMRYAELTAGKTAVYISHRLASTRFCDRIILLDGHTIAEVGTHDELMARGGKYAEMFGVQASYYKKDFNKTGEGGDDGEQ
ncbi:MAG: ABC transporter ATP-binding protein/permease [Oscillospiraceae bacterium]|nr:ABC transporter ATP-binding protein/permease [Oscillospiraceae bacterium]